MIYEIVYLGRDNTIELLLKADGVAQDLTPVTKMVLKDEDGGWELDSSLLPALFDWNTGVTGKLVLDLGSSNIPPGYYTCSLIVFDSSNTNGIVWGNFVIEFRS